MNQNSIIIQAKLMLIVQAHATSYLEREWLEIAFDVKLRNIGDNKMKSSPCLLSKGTLPMRAAGWMPRFHHQTKDSHHHHEGVPFLPCS